jgi:predicted RNase H-like HicB family nuclease
MAVGYEYTLERQANGWWLVRFPRIPEALTEGETEEEARTNAIDCVITALEGVHEGRQAGSQTVRAGSRPGPSRAPVFGHREICGLRDDASAWLVQDQAGQRPRRPGKFGAPAVGPAP